MGQARIRRLRELLLGVAAAGAARRRAKATAHRGNASQIARRDSRVLSRVIGFSEYSGYAAILSLCPFLSCARLSRSLSVLSQNRGSNLDYPGPSARLPLSLSLPRYFHVSPAAQSVTRRETLSLRAADVCARCAAAALLFSRARRRSKRDGR